MIPRMKTKLHYRKVGKHEPKNCFLCGHRVTMDIRFIGGGFNKKDWRCVVIGLEHSIRYAVREDHVCDRFAYFPKKEA